MKREGFLVILCSLVATVNAVGQNVSVDKQLGEEGFLSVQQEMGLYQHDSLQKLVVSVGHKLVSRLSDSPFEFKFFLADSPEPNAFALPGGYVFVTRGILPLIQTEDQLAGIMAHEIIHVTERHSIKQMKKGVLPRILRIPGNLINAVTGTHLGNVLNAPISLSQKAFTAKYSQKHESEADKFGIQLAASAGYNAVALAEALEILSREVEVLTGEAERQNYFSDHPYTPTRVAAISKLAPSYRPVNPAPVTTSKEDFLSKFNGLIFGQNPEQGVFKDSLFIHPDLSLSWILPSGWQSLNLPSLVAGFTEKGDGMVTLRIADGAESAKQAGEELKKKMTEQASKSSNLKFVYAGDSLINGFTCYVIKLRSVGTSPEVAMDLIWTNYQGVVLQLAGISTLALSGEMMAALASFRKATEEELKSVNLYEIRLVSALANETLEEISHRANNKLSMPMTALINNTAQESTLINGQSVKVIEERPYLPRQN